MTVSGGEQLNASLARCMTGLRRRFESLHFPQTLPERRNVNDN
jgi:hypothetical protein